MTFANFPLFLGDNVEFTIQTRNGKEVATNITKLPTGTVVFEDVGTEYYRGQVLKPIDRNYRLVAEGDALSGRVKYRGPDRSEKEVQFGETDQVLKKLISTSLRSLLIFLFTLRLEILP